MRKALRASASVALYHNEQKAHHFGLYDCYEEGEWPSRCDKAKREMVQICPLLIYPPGLEAVRELTSQGTWDLRVDLEDKTGTFAYASYSSFRLGSEANFYPLLFDSYTGGTAGMLCI